VWLAEDENLFNRAVALKMIRPRTPPEKRRILLEAPRSEAELLVSVHHPNLVQVLRWLDSPEEAALVLQYVRGGSLADRLAREGPLDLAVGGALRGGRGRGSLRRASGGHHPPRCQAGEYPLGFGE
jgi:eukaryotic-like serine/threonine-protein kinase